MSVDGGARQTSRRRADASRNRGRILDAARALFAEHGPDAGMDAIAARAGVAVGTLYNHFGTKEDLLAAAVADTIDRATVLTLAAAERAEAGADPWTELEALLRALAAMHLEDRAYKSRARDLGLVPAFDEEVGRRLLAAAGRLLACAKAAGQLRSDVETMDLALLLSGLPGPEVAGTVRDRLLDIVLAGLCAPGFAPAAGPGRSADPGSAGR